MELDKMINTE